MSDSEVEDGLPFVINEWIGKGRKVPEANSFPLGLANYFSAVTEVPENIKNKYYPNVHLTVKELRVLFIGQLGGKRRNFALPLPRHHTTPGDATTSHYDDI